VEDRDKVNGTEGRKGGLERKGGGVLSQKKTRRGVGPKTADELDVKKKKVVQV